MVITLKVKLGTHWSAEIELADNSTLADVHLAIQQAVDFDNDHLYEFFVARTERARDRISYDDENGGIYDTRIQDLFPLPAKRQLFYLFDYGNSWIFKISKSRKAPRDPTNGVEYPHVAKETGEKPVQYDSDDEEF